MSDLFGNHIVGFPTRQLLYSDLAYSDTLIAFDDCMCMKQVISY